MAGSQELDLEGYLERVGHRGDLRPEVSTLETLHLEHLARIPFENVDVRLGRPLGLDLGSLQAKLVRRRRGGYCFEHNTLFAAVLRALGFEVATLEARVRPPGATAPLPRTHMVLRAEAGGRSWLADVGFGGDGPLLPVPLDGSTSEQADGSYAIGREGRDVHVLRRLWGGSWRDLYAFTPTPALAVDFAVAHHFTATHPESAFVRTLTVQRSEPAVRHILRGRTHTVRRGREETVRELSVAEIPALLRNELELNLSDEEVLQALDDPGPETHPKGD